ncbi:MAG: hypothetical protein HN413_07065 [Chloroflexi bacterium]|jgi:hypothetical protein|nr:hypothetical protein [Chloroflexota bacterium]
MTYFSRDPVSAHAAARVLARTIFRRFFWQGKLLPAFWTVMSISSFVVNIILIVLLVALSQQVSTLKDLVSTQLLTGLSDNFAAMDKAVIETSIIVDDTIPVQFDLPVSTTTNVILTQPTSIRGAQVAITSGILSINAPADIILPAGTSLPIALDITVPVNETVPVHLVVDVSIPLKDTGLHDPFVGLQQVVEPYNQLLMQESAPLDEWDLCQGDWGFLCDLYSLLKK